MTSDTDFWAPWWLRNPHLQSCYATAVRGRARVVPRWEEVRLPDDDFVDVAWFGEQQQPIIILLHGLEGSWRSHYIQLMLDELVALGWQVAVLHYRTCSGRMNRLAESYNGGETKDFAYLVALLQQRFPGQAFYALGFSLGGNILLQYLASNPQAPIAHAIAVSTPYLLGRSADCLPVFYQRSLLKSMKAKSLQKLSMGLDFPVGAVALRAIKTLRQFDERVTAPTYGFASADAYYAFASVRDRLRDIRHSTTIIHALDDPFVPRDTVPALAELSPSIDFKLSQRGGHVGFIQGGWPWAPKAWLQSYLLKLLACPKY